MRQRLTLLALVLLAACSAEEQATLTITELQIPAPLPGVSMGAGYFVLSNNSAQPVRITRVESPELSAVDMHETILDNDVSRMVKLQQLDIPANSAATFERGGKHLMLRYPNDIPASVTLNFFSDDQLLLTVTATPKD